MFKGIIDIAIRQIETSNIIRNIEKLGKIRKFEEKSGNDRMATVDEDMVIFLIFLVTAKNGHDIEIN